jgi:hypothetical protein
LREAAPKSDTTLVTHNHTTTHTHITTIITNNIWSDTVTEEIPYWGSVKSIIGSVSLRSIGTVHKLLLLLLLLLLRTIDRLTIRFEHERNLIGIL